MRECVDCQGSIPPSDRHLRCQACRRGTSHKRDWPLCKMCTNSFLTPVSQAKGDGLCGYCRSYFKERNAKRNRGSSDSPGVPGQP